MITTFSSLRACGIHFRRVGRYQFFDLRRLPALIVCVDAANVVASIASVLDNE